MQYTISLQKTENDKMIEKNAENELELIQIKREHERIKLQNLTRTVNLDTRDDEEMKAFIGHEWKFKNKNSWSILYVYLLYSKNMKHIKVGLLTNEKITSNDWNNFKFGE